MRLRPLAAALTLVTTAAFAAPDRVARGGSVVEWLEAYSRGDHDRVVTALTPGVDFEEILVQMRRDAPGWIAAGGNAHTAHRRLVAATVALEAARAGAREDWKRIQKQPDLPLNVLYWKAPPLLIEWGCALFRQEGAPTDAERWWQLAALAVANYSEDQHFLVGDPAIGRGGGMGEIMNLQDEIKHLDHITTRFPNEPRFALGQGIARDRQWPDDAVQAYRALERNADVGGEAMMRLGAMQMRLRRAADALKQFDRALELTRDPYVVYLAHFFSGQIYERQPNLKLAEDSYRRAVAAIPRAQSATLALATLLARDGRRAEAQQLVTAMTSAVATSPDPWRTFVRADDRFWPLLIARLRREIGG